MNTLQKVRPLADYTLELTYDPQTIRLFDVKPYLEKGRFQELKDPDKFNQVRISFDTVCWANGVDLCPEVLYQDSKALS